MSRAKMLQKLTCDTLVKVSDQIGAVLAQAHVAQDNETIDSLMPALASIWQLRWELNVTAGDVAGASKESVARERFNEAVEQRGGVS